MKRVSPTLPGGFRDYLPAEMIVRLQMLAKIREVFERYGFDPLDTPGMERRAMPRPRYAFSTPMSSWYA